MKGGLRANEGWGKGYVWMGQEVLRVGQRVLLGGSRGSEGKGIGHGVVHFSP